MKTFKQFIAPSINEDVIDLPGVKATKELTDTAAQKILQAKQYKPTSGPGQFIKGVLTGDAEPGTGQIAATAWELVDPSGISSIDDAVEAYTNFSKAPNPITASLWFLALFCCTPNLGLFIGSGAGAAAGAPAAGVGAVPGAVAGGLIGGGLWIAIKRGALSLLKRALKNPTKYAKEVEEMTAKVGSHVTKVPGGPEAVVTTAEKIADLTGKPLTAEGREAVTKIVGGGTGVKIDATPKPKDISGAEYMKMSDAEKAAINKTYAAKAEDLMGSKFKFKGDKTDSPAFTELYDQQKYFLGERLAKKGEDINKLSPEEVRKKVIEYIVDNPNDDLIEKGLKEVAKEVGDGTSIETVINGVKKSFPGYKYYEPKTAAAAVEDVAVKTGTKAAGEASVETGAKAATETGTKATTDTTAKAASETAEKTATREVSDSVSKQAGLAIGRLLLKPVRYALIGAGTAAKATARAVSNAANQITAFVISGVEKGQQAGGVLGPNKDPERVKRAKQDVGVSPKDNYGEIVYTFNGKILTPAQASALGTFATPARYNYSTERWEEIKTLQPGQQIPIDYADGTKSDAEPPKTKQKAGKYDTTSSFEDKLK